MTIGTAASLAIITALTTAAESRFLVHLLQLESYQLRGFIRAAFKYDARVILPSVLCSVVNIAMLGIMPWVVSRYVNLADSAVAVWLDDSILYICAAVCLAVAVAVYIHLSKMQEKKPLVITPRVKRLAVSILIVSFAISFIIIYYLKLVPVGVALPLFSVFVVMLASVCVSPVENAIKRHYFNDAKRILQRRTDLIKIGITGSYGKTSTKFFLQSILSEKYSTLATPSSFNTPMGITRVVRESLKPLHEVFIAEMGARHTKDIKELCELVAPKYGILTSVGTAHMETFGSQENITNTKFDLIRCLPNDGAAVFADDSAIVRGLFEKTNHTKTYIAGVENNNNGSSDNKNNSDSRVVSAKDIEVGAEGSRFTLNLPNGVSIGCETVVLGEHNIQNITLASAMAFELGVSPDEIKAGIAKIEPVPHRLQIIKGAGGVIVIDDAYNSNPSGVAAALRVLQKFYGRKILVTPGMVELGENSHNENSRLGSLAASVCDYVIIVAQVNRIAIAEGLLAGGFSAGNIRYARTIDDARNALASLPVLPGDVVLFENDLPDNYK